MEWWVRVGYMVRWRWVELGERKGGGVVGGERVCMFVKGKGREGDDERVRVDEGMDKQS